MRGQPDQGAPAVVTKGRGRPDQGALVVVERMGNGGDCEAVVGNYPEKNVRRQWRG